jgi:hypothetical protein
MKRNSAIIVLSLTFAIFAQIKFDPGAYYPFYIKSYSPYGDPILETNYNGWGMLGTGSHYLYYIYTQNLVEGSDERIKENIADISDGLCEKLANVRCVTYTMPRIKDSKKIENADERKQVGFIAQNLKEVFPEVVEYDERSDSYGVQYTRMVPILLSAIKEQQKMIEKQQEQIEQLKLIAESR